MSKQNSDQNDVPYQFTERVLTVSLPTAFMLIILVAAGEIDAMSAIVGFAMVVCLTIVLAMPFLMNLKNLTQYVHQIAQEEEVSDIPVFGKKMKNLPVLSPRLIRCAISGRRARKNWKRRLCPTPPCWTVCPTLC